MFDEAAGGDPDPGAPRPPEPTAALADGWCVPGVTPPGPAEPAVEVPAPVLLALRAAVDAAVHAVHEAGPVSGRPAGTWRCCCGAPSGCAGWRCSGSASSTRPGSTRAGAVSAAAWLRRTQGIGEDTARASVRLAGRVRADLPELGGRCPPAG